MGLRKGTRRRMGKRKGGLPTLGSKEEGGGQLGVSRGEKGEDTTFLSFSDGGSQW